MRKQWTVVALIAAVLLPQASALCWDDTGHMLVAQITHSRLNGKAKERVDKLVKVIQSGARSDTFVECACWMDDIRDSRPETKPFHFINKPCNGQNPSSPHVLSTVDDCIKVLKSSASDKQKAEKLRFLVHLVGDLHQPLHCIDRDRGGNDFKIGKIPDGLWEVDNLHSFWDRSHRSSVVGSSVTLQSGVERPLEQQNRQQQVEKAAQNVTAEYTPTKLSAKLKEKNRQKWVDESNHIACTFCFVGLKPNQKLSPNYVKTARDTARERIALAGYRLAELLNEIFGQ